MNGAPLLYSGHGWLAGMLPADARRFRSADGAIATTLAHAGGELVDHDPDVEFGPVGMIRGDSDVSIVPLGQSKLDVSSRTMRAVRRFAVSTGVRAQARRVQHRLARRGYVHVRTLVWDVGQPLRAPGEPIGDVGLVGRLPQQGAVVGARTALGQTALEAAVAEAQDTSGIPLGSGPATVREGLLVMPGEAAFLRVAIGPARHGLDRHFENIKRLQADGVPSSVADRVPLAHARGRRNLVDWSVEGRLPGSPPGHPLADEVISDCVDFLVDLHTATAAPSPDGGADTAAAAEIVAAACPQPEAALLQRLAEWAEDRLVDVPRGFGHGDFFHGNLLVRDGRLTGVVDWDTAATATLPYLDLFHLRVFGEHRPADREWGAVLTEHIMPLARSGGDGLLREYGHRIGVDPTAAQLEALVIAYWLQRLAFQVGTVADRLVRASWLRENVYRPARRFSEVVSA